MFGAIINGIQMFFAVITFSIYFIVRDIYRWFVPVSDQTQVQSQAQTQLLDESQNRS
jgi:hypothetical protein